jgi:predicted PurR-regulated permease PerM
VTEAPPNRTAARITLAVISALTLYAIWRIAGPYVEALAVGALLATLWDPLQRRLVGMMRPSVAAMVSTALVIVLVVIPLAFAVTALVQQLREVSGAELDELWVVVDRVAARFGLAGGELRAMAQARVQGAVEGLLRGSISAAGAATGGVLQFMVAMGAFHFCLRNGAALRVGVVDHSPLGRARTETLLDTVHHMIRASFYGVVAVAGAQGALLGLGAWIAGLPIPALWGIAGMLVSVLPLLGSALVWVPGSILLLAQGKIGMGLFFLAWSAILVANADNVVRPLVVMASLPVSGLLVFIAILGGLQAFGLIGIFAGPVTLAVAIALLKMLREELSE